MAYDKVIDSSVLDGNLTSIANAIREKAELTENFAFPQGFIEAISGIESGGGDVTFDKGTITIAEELEKITIQHNLGRTPVVIFLMMSSGTPTNNKSSASLLIYDFVSIKTRFYNASTTLHTGYYVLNKTNINLSTYWEEMFANSNEANFNCYTYLTTVYRFNVGTYKWFVV